MLAERTLAGLHDFLEPEAARLGRTTPVLDLGCGSGAWLARLKRLGFCDLTGIDSGPPAGGSDFSYFRANLDASEIRLERQYGLITMIEVIEHLANPGVALTLISGQLTPDGVALVTTPNIHSLRCRLKFLLNGRLASFDEKGDPTHVTPILLSGFEKIVERLGLQVTECWTYPRFKSLIFGASIRAAATVLRPVVPDPLPGDTLCLRLTRRR